MSNKPEVAGLPARISWLYSAIPEADVDVPVALLHQHVFPDSGKVEYAYQQMGLGPYITKLNRRLRTVKLKLRPGVARRTYRLSSL